ncbi:type II toxin-antitoxin system ParD family antitoxin [Azospirillum rugosum]|uniref:Antitoxin ParD1/3/4 n=1 Tax=Azospirillum rugosum TaxID=416170 RepID=A0ABS4SKU5_9PROT|nr:type II toxin-antitoxin system ParD family antitoxin [Azospirillum rugosum]MBP2293120.1 antitoxin ParD1/3/4 [Azospirillum rugosum]MDQ0526669.1 antitoxin ParD1/3/4 [Azospirillum rugosum]
MNVSLTPELERLIEQRVASGQYTSASEVMREALRLFFRYDESRSREIDRLNQRIAEGLAQLDRGEAIPAEEARRRTKERIAARRKAKRAD